MEVIEKKGFNGFQLKLLALILMVFDHIRYFFSFANIPIWFNWLGRIVAPIFIFTTVEGYVYTRDKKKYMLRLYVGYVFMQVFNSLVVDWFPRKEILPIINSMFGSLFLLVLYLVLWDLGKEGFKNKEIGKIVIAFVGMALPVVIDKLIFSLMVNSDLPFIVFRIGLTFIPLLSLVEGGLLWIALGFIFYLFRENKKFLAIAYILYVGGLFFPRPNLMGPGSDIGFLENAFYVNYQWMMLFALAFIYNYNGEEGPKMKYLFYIFYPSHIYFLYIIGTLVFNRFYS